MGESVCGLRWRQVSAECGELVPSGPETVPSVAVIWSRLDKRLARAESGNIMLCEILSARRGGDC